MDRFEILSNRLHELDEVHWWLFVSSLAWLDGTYLVNQKLELQFDVLFTRAVHLQMDELYWILHEALLVLLGADEERQRNLLQDGVDLWLDHFSWNLVVE